MGMRHLTRLALLGLLIGLAGCSAVSGLGHAANTSPSTDTGGPVSIGTDHTQYGAKDSIQVTVTNHTQQAVYAWDTKANCSILDLEVQTGGAWQSALEAHCAMKRAAAPVKIDPGATYSATIRAGLLPNSDAEFTGGAHRLMLAYAASPTPANSATTLVYSSLLTITGGASNGENGPGEVPMGTPRAR